ncbi:hypothetical protein GCM10009715_31060 [Paeniglutamicibacter psychrophenolicus]|uniref:YdhG-like domain-containing protein n=1 Tax=Paeniglutamicibacter psychrophenolicus TaxID=257454 RepID=A0ABS4W917_9MICC|nr:DUF1801 domain-containing protein [Paeniglutamicibacter psychrophenolicus]MBP2372695.1 hypothetical protein [Paeniglutamicibacter psychrophenolicus]
MTANKTAPTPVDPHEFIAAVPHPTRRADAELLMEMMEVASGQPATMWGPTIVGFGTYHYKYESGREGDAVAIGFSPRSANLALYGLTIAPTAPALLAKLGKHKRGAGCLYVNKLADVDVEILAQLARDGYRHMMDAVHVQPQG